MNHESEVAELLGIGAGSRLWIVGDSVEETALLDPLPEGVDTFDDEVPEQLEGLFDDTWTGAENRPEPPEPVRPTGIDTAIIAVSNTQEFHMRLDDVLPRMGSVNRVWVLYPSDDLPFTILENGVGEYGWTVTDPLALDETWSAAEIKQT